MKITLESTSKLVTLEGPHGWSVPARVWEGETETGIPVHCYVTRIAVAEGRPPEDYRAFEEGLMKQRKPSVAVDAIPLRLIL